MSQVNRSDLYPQATMPKPSLHQAVRAFLAFLDTQPVPPFPETWADQIREAAEPLRRLVK